jgi:hypothetical protein
MDQTAMEPKRLREASPAPPTKWDLSRAMVAEAIIELLDLSGLKQWLFSSRGNVDLIMGFTRSIIRGVSLFFHCDLPRHDSENYLHIRAITIDVL